MLKEERQKYILNRINNDNRIYVTSLSLELGVSDDTIRRDLKELKNKRLLTKVHGGAISKSGISLEFTDRLNTATTIKQQMTTKVIPLFNEGDCIVLDGGTSNLEVAKQMPLEMKLTIYTNSFPIVNALFNHPQIDLFFMGGKVFPSSQVTIGLTVYQFLQTVTPNWAIVGISDIHPEKGITCQDREEAIIKRSIIERAQKTIVVADSYKLGTARTYSVASLGDIDYLVTEDDRVNFIKTHWPKYSYKVI